MKNIILSAFVLAVALVACSKETVINEDNLGVGTTSDGSTRLTFRLTDAPGAYDKVNIDLQAVQVIINDTIIDLKVNKGVYNLLDFVNGKDTVIVNDEIPSGKLSQIRLILGDNNTIVEGGTDHPMKTPSAQQSGLKLNVHANFLQGFAYEYIIDFDASRSIVKTGNGKFILKPVLRAFTRAVSGTVEGVVSPAKAKPKIFAITGANDTAATTLSDTITGRFMLRGLAEGTYNLAFKPDTIYRDTILKNIVVRNEMVTKLDTLKFKKK